MTDKDHSEPKLDPLDRFVWGASSIAAIINRSPRQAYYLAQHGLIDVDRIGTRWRSTPRRLLKPQRFEAAE